MIASLAIKELNNKFKNASEMIVGKPLKSGEPTLSHPTANLKQAAVGEPKEGTPLERAPQANMDLSVC